MSEQSPKQKATMNKIIDKLFDAVAVLCLGASFVGIIAVVIVGVATFAGVSCTEHERARNYGGSATVTLPPGEKLVNVTWKKTNIWYLTRPMRADEKPETYYFRESSALGVAQGKITVNETAK